ncbi:MAG: ATP synthase F1 subunit gamma [Actinomycetota bacterium]|nr:ATP synthase F1 subunit gamma [Actinomycetota bacterium]
MAGGQERVLRRRIRSVQSTKKITKAMELIAASQIVRSQSRIAANRPYRAGMARLVAEAALGDPTAAAKLLGVPGARRKVAVLSIVADRGLSGPYNSSVLRATERLLGELGSEGIEARLYTVGKKAVSYFRFRGQPVEHSFVGMSERPAFADARAVATAVAAPFVAGDVDQVLLVSTRFHSAGRQEVQTLQLLPMLDPADRVSEDGATPVPGRALGGYTEFEPDVETLLAELAPKAVESEVFSALLEGAASFFTAQQRAMAAASDNADELVRTLSRIMNRARQDAITTEIMEIVGGAEALRQSKGA